MTKTAFEHAAFEQTFEPLETYRVENVEQARLVYDPEYGIRLLGFFVEPHIASDAAKKLNEPANRIAYHIGKLADAGLLRVVGTRGKRTLYRTIAREFVVPKMLLPMHLSDTRRAAEPLLRGLLEGMANATPDRDAEGVVVRLTSDDARSRAEADELAWEVVGKAEFVPQLQIAPVKLAPRRFRELQEALARLVDEYREQPDDEHAQECTVALISYRGTFRPGSS